MRLSIITINYNNAEGLRKTIESVLMQTFRNFEYIIVDGASTDDSISILKDEVSKLTSFAGDDDSITACGEAKGNQVFISASASNNWDVHKLVAQEKSWRYISDRLKIVSEKDKGIYNAMNKGIRMAEGEYCLFLNSGDALHDKNVLARIIPLLGEADVHSFDADFVYPDGARERHAYPDTLTFDFLYCSSFCHQALFYRTERLRAMGGYNEQYRIIGDWVLNVQLLIQNNASYKHNAICTTDYDMTGVSWSREGREQDQKEREQFLQTILPERVLIDYETRNNLRKEPDIQHWLKIRGRYTKKVISWCIRICSKIENNN